MKYEKELFDAAKSLGAHDFAIIEAASVPLRREFRAACEANTCGKFGRCWTCPPDIGDIDELIDRIQKYEWVLVYQSVWPLEDSFDIEGMEAAAEGHNALCQALTQKVGGILRGEVLRLGAGGCQICERCAKLGDELCRFPEQAIASLEAYGIAVSELAELCGMKYINGQNTVTYFGAFFYGDRREKSA